LISFKLHFKIKKSYLVQKNHVYIYIIHYTDDIKFDKPVGFVTLLRAVAGKKCEQTLRNGTAKTLKD